jgi:hypothetical protein
VQARRSVGRATKKRIDPPRFPACSPAAQGEFLLTVLADRGNRPHRRSYDGVSVRSIWHGLACPVRREAARPDAFYAQGRKGCPWGFICGQPWLSFALRRNVPRACGALRIVRATRNGPTMATAQLGLVTE